MTIERLPFHILIYKNKTHFSWETQFVSIFSAVSIKPRKKIQARAHTMSARCITFKAMWVNYITTDTIRQEIIILQSNSNNGIQIYIAPYIICKALRRFTNVIKCKTFLHEHSTRTLARARARTHTHTHTHTHIYLKIADL